MFFYQPAFFLLFLPVAVGGYFWLNYSRFYKGGMLYLLLCSLVFYGLWDWRYLFLIGASILVNFWIGRRLCRWCTQKKTWLILGITFNLVLLGYYKYADFFLGNINMILGTDFSLLHLLLPLGISFFTFQQIMYLVDCWRRRHKPDYRLWHYANFVFFFPQLIAGPIVHHDEMMPQFHEPKKKEIHWNHIFGGGFLFAVGFFKKVMIADGLGVIVDNGYDNISFLPSLAAWGIALAYTFQIYFDFSGYTDMALGIARMFNIKLPFNFNQPYKARGIREFWSRWHMTLTRFLRNYIYIPLGGSKISQWRTYLNILLVFFLSGLWHGAGWTFVLWGMAHGIGMVIERFFHHRRWIWPKFFQWSSTFLFLVLSWVLFRSRDLSVATAMYRALFAGQKTAQDTFFDTGKSISDVFPWLQTDWWIDLWQTLLTHHWWLLGSGLFLISVGIILRYIWWDAPQLWEKWRPSWWNIVVILLCMGVGIVAQQYIENITPSTEFLYSNF